MATGLFSLRREEERRSLDLLLATPCSRLRVLAEKLAALIAALAVTTVQRKPRTGASLLSRMRSASGA